jgi:outer membrane lipoprotein-sorting protein
LDVSRRRDCWSGGFWRVDRGGGFESVIKRKGSSERKRIKTTEEILKMVRKSFAYVFLLLLISLSLWGCPKRPPEIIHPEKPFENPIVKILEAFSPAESLQSRVSIRIDVVRNGEEMNFLLNGFILYQKPDQLRILGYHPLGMGLFDALYRNGEFLVLIIPQKKAYVGEVSQFEGLIERAGPIEVSVEKPEGSEIPNRIRINVTEKETRIDLRLKEISVNSSLPADSFEWSVPEGVDVRPLAQLLRGKKLK